jgi:hypothetical protein
MEWGKPTFVNDVNLQEECINTIKHSIEAAGHSGRAVQGMKCPRPLEHWDRGFESS